MLSAPREIQTPDILVRLSGGAHVDVMSPLQASRCGMAQHRRGVSEALVA
jgi:hypothetical protein